MLNNNLLLCGAASGGGYGTNETVCVSLAASGLAPESDDSESLELAVTFGALDSIGYGLTLIPEPHCQIVGHGLSIPSRVMWMYQCYRLGRKWLNKPRR